MSESKLPKTRQEILIDILRKKPTYIVHCTDGDISTRLDILSAFSPVFDAIDDGAECKVSFSTKVVGLIINLIYDGAIKLDEITIPVLWDCYKFCIQYDIKIATDIITGYLISFAQDHKYIKDIFKQYTGEKIGISIFNTAVSTMVALAAHSKLRPCIDNLLVIRSGIVNTSLQKVCCQHTDAKLLGRIIDNVTGKRFCCHVTGDFSRAGTLHMAMPIDTHTELCCKHRTGVAQWEREYIKNVVTTFHSIVDDAHPDIKSMILHEMVKSL